MNKEDFKTGAKIKQTNPTKENYGEVQTITSVLRHSAGETLFVATDKRQVAFSVDSAYASSCVLVEKVKQLA